MTSRDEEHNERVAYHEAGHALVAILLGYEVTKATIEKNESTGAEGETTAVRRDANIVTYLLGQLGIISEKDSEDQIAYLMALRAWPFRLFGSVALALICISLFEYIVHRFGWGWLLTHTNSYGLRGAAYLMIFSVFLWLFGFKRFSLGTFFAALIFVVLPMLGGPKQ